MASLMGSLIKAYRNEKCTKEILPYQESLMQFLIKNLPIQIEYKNSIKDMPALKCVYEQEIERIKYFIKEYIKARLIKINKNLKIEKSNLGEHEIRYMKSIHEIYKQEDVLVDCNWKNYEFVGFVSQNSGRNIILDQSAVELKKDDFFVAPVSEIIDLLNQDEVYLA